MSVAEDTAKDAHQLARQMGRGEVRAASVAWGHGGRAAAGAAAARRSGGRARAKRLGRLLRLRRPEQVPAPALPIRPARVGGQVADGPAQTAATPPAAAKAEGRQGQRADGWLIAPYADQSGQGRDSFGRGTSPGEIAATVAADKAVQREREARWSYLQGAYRDPHAARAALDELVKSQGWTSAASRIEADPLQLGELRGKEGLFAGAKARAERVAAQRAAGAIGSSLSGSARPRRGRSGPIARAWMPSVRQTRPASRACPPQPRRRSAVVAAAPDEKARAEAWWAVQATSVSRASCGAFGAAVQQRFGEEGVRTMLRAGGQPGAVTAASVAPEQRPELDRVAELTIALKAGEAG